MKSTLLAAVNKLVEIKMSPELLGAALASGRYNEQAEDLAERIAYDWNWEHSWG